MSDSSTGANDASSSGGLQPGGGETGSELATLGGGCFWCLEAVFEQLRGVQSVVSGYCGGHVINPRYEDVCNAETGHVEVVQVTFDPAVVPYATILDVFFATHDPTTLNRQGNDVGPQYRSAIFFHSEAQKTAAISKITELTDAGLFDRKIVTEVTAMPTFYPAEKYHQGYYRGHPMQGYCQVVISPKVAKFRKQFEQYLR